MNPFILLLFPILIGQNNIQIDSLLIVDDVLKKKLEESHFRGKKDIVLIEIKQMGHTEFELRITLTENWFTSLIKHEYDHESLYGIFEYNNLTGFVYGDRCSSLFQKIGETNIPDYYTAALNKKPRPPEEMDPNIPPARYNVPVYYFIYKEGTLSIDRWRWAKLEK